jgi:hypothetical protein
MNARERYIKVLACAAWVERLARAEERAGSVVDPYSQLEIARAMSRPIEIDCRTFEVGRTENDGLSAIECWETVILCPECHGDPALFSDDPTALGAVCCPTCGQDGSTTVWLYEDELDEWAEECKRA